MTVSGQRVFRFALAFLFVWATFAAPLRSQKAGPITTAAPDGQVMSFRAFLNRVLRHDPNFQLILMQRLYLRYGKALAIPADDLLLGVNGTYGVFIPADGKERISDRRYGVSLTKLFPETGTRLALNYSKGTDSGAGAARRTTTMGFEVGQAIGRNAFGRATRKTIRQVQVQTALARHQIVEAYEDYLASLLVVYLSRHRARERTAAARSAADEARSIYNLTRRKARFGVAYRNEIRKSRLDLITARESLAAARAEEKTSRVRIAFLAGLNMDANPVTRLPELDSRDVGSKPGARTRNILKLLAREGILEREIQEANLLPSAEMFAGYEVLGSRYDLPRPDRRFYFGASLNLNFGRRLEKARAAAANLDSKRARMETRARSLNLDRDLTILSHQVKAGRELLKLARERRKTAAAILRAERYDYRLGRSGFTELSRARVQLEQARTDLIEREIALVQLRVEFLRLADQLVRKLPSR